MPKVVQVPGVGNVQFPDNMSDEQISSAIQKQVGPPKPMSPLSQLASGTYKPEPDALEKTLNYRTGNNYVDAPLGVAQGAIKAGVEHAHEAANLLRKIPGVAAADDYLRNVTGEGPRPTDAQVQQQTKAQGVGQGTGKFLEGAAEYAIPAGAVGKAAKGAGLLARMGAQAATAGAVSAAQSGGDPTATATGAVLGAGGELVGPAIGTAKKAISALTKQAPTLKNYAVSFAKATGRQKEIINDAIPLLQQDGIKPTGNALDTQAAIKNKLSNLGAQYEAKKADWATAKIPAEQILQKIIDSQELLRHEGHLLSGNEAADKILEKQGQDILQLASPDGSISFSALRKLRDVANTKAKFTDEADLFRKVGDVYRAGMDAASPGTAALNRQYQQYSTLEDIIDKNIAQGKHETPGFTDALASKLAAHGTGAAAGAHLGYQVAGAPGAFVGGLVGGIAGPKLAKGTMQVLQNAVDSGAFQKLPRVNQLAIQAASKMGDNKAVLRLLGQGAGQELALQGAQ